MLSRARHFFKSRPMFANMATYGTLYTFAEASQQVILNSAVKRKADDEKSSALKGIDWHIIGRYGIISVGILGPVLFYWYRFLDAVMPASTRKAVLAKVFVDQAVAGTGAITIFFTGMSILEGKEDIFAELKAKFLSTYTLSCCFWLPAQAINFALLPPYTRVAFVGVASFVWVNVLCLVKRQKYVEEKADESPTIVLESGAK